MKKIELVSCLTQQLKTVGYGDPVWDSLDNKRYRLAGQTPDGFIELMTDEGRKLPDYRHITQVKAY